MKREFEEEYVEVNGIAHFLLHYPKASDAPVLLYLHGGPGSMESLFAYELDKAWGRYVHPGTLGSARSRQNTSQEQKARYAGNNRTDAG